MQQVGTKCGMAHEANVDNSAENICLNTSDFALMLREGTQQLQHAKSVSAKKAAGGVISCYQMIIRGV